MNTQPQSPNGDEEFLPLPGKPMVGPVTNQNVHRETFLYPWPNWRIWIVPLVGVSVGHVIGFSPLLFVLIGALCLACGWFRNS